MAIKENLFHAFLFNLEAYDEGIIDRDDFINAMEEYIYEIFITVFSYQCFVGYCFQLVDCDLSL